MRFALSTIVGALFAATAVAASEHQVRHTPRHHAHAAREAHPEPLEERGPSNWTLEKRDYSNARFTFFDVGLYVISLASGL